MKKIGVLILLALLLQGCVGNKSLEKEHGKLPASDGIVVPINPPMIPTEEVPSISLASSTFHSVIGWLTNDEIAFVLLDKGEWTVQTYTISNGSWRLIYTSTTPIIQAYIHPNKELILLHTSSNSSSAEVQIIHKNGYLVQSLTFESAELYLDWHPTNPDLIVFTTFYEDWTYNTFVYDGSSQVLQSIEVDNPFVKWYDDEHLMVFKGADSSLDGNELMLYSIKDRSLKETGTKHLVEVLNLGESKLYIQINEQQKLYEYHLEDDELENSYEWTSPAISNYSEWVVPIISTVNADQIVVIKAIESGNIDESASDGILTSISLEGERELGKITTQPIACSPDGKVCLGGYEKEKWIQLNPLKEQVWIHLGE